MIKDNDLSIQQLEELSKLISDKKNNNNSSKRI
jgi:hypothetical protein